MAGDRDTLLGMGFEPARVDWALKATGNRGLQPAMDHVLEHEGQPVPDISGVAESSNDRDTMDVEDEEEAEALRMSLGSAENAEAKSIKCSECGKIFRDTALANFHAEKSGHDQFEESTDEVKPLTEEEKLAKLAELRQKLAEKRSKKAEEELNDHKVNENIRRKAGKDLNKLREDIQVKQALKEAENKKREKLEDAKAKAAVKAQIEADKKARAEKAAREKALRDGHVVPDASPAALASSKVVAPSSVAGRNYKETRLQIRMSSSAAGGPYTVTLSSEATLREVAEFVAAQTLSVDVETVSFSQQFPRKQFSHSDFLKTLRELELTPSAVLFAS